MNTQITIPPEQELAQAETGYLIATFYRFVSLPDCAEIQRKLLDYGRMREPFAGKLHGTILVAEEGINATIAAQAPILQAMLELIQSDPRLANLPIRYSHSERQPFERFKVRLKREIVTLSQECDPTQQVGTYVSPQDWNALISDPEVLLVDTRNLYETAIGTFKGAVDPGIQSFHEFPEYVNTELDPAKHRRVATFCTGGIRCEKATSWMLAQGFEEVYHLKGGILSYLEQIPAEESLWQGECFVFDERVAVTHGLSQGEHSNCLGCGRAVSPEDLKDPSYEDGVSCPACFHERSDEQKARSRMSWQQMQKKN